MKLKRVDRGTPRYEGRSLIKIDCEEVEIHSLQYINLSEFLSDEEYMLALSIIERELHFNDVSFRLLGRWELKRVFRWACTDNEEKVIDKIMAAIKEVGNNIYINFR